MVSWMLVYIAQVLTFFSFSNAVETFITFLKEIDSPDEVTEYVNQYLSISKASRDFAKHFITKRSYLRNKARQQQQQEVR